MGFQEILLISLSVILVGIALSVGMNIFRANILDNNKDAIINDLSNLSARCYIYRVKPREIDGGGGSYMGLESSDLGTFDLLDNANGSYELSNIDNDQVILTATGKQGKSPWIITCTVDESGFNSFEIEQAATFKLAR